MSLTALHWRKLPTRIITSSFSVNNMLNNIYDMLTGSLYHDGSARVPGSASAWQNVGRFITGSGTGSNTEAVYCYPPTQTALSQSVVIAGRNSTGAVTNVAPAILAGNNGTIATNTLAVACVKNAGVFSSWTTGSNGFGAGSVSTGYATFVSSSNNSHASVNKVYIYESEEAIAIFMNANGGTQNSAGTFGFIAGAFIDPEQTTTADDAESDNRLYAVMTSTSINSTTNPSVYGMGATFYSVMNSGNDNGFLEHFADLSNNVGVGPKFAMFTPQTSSTTTMKAIKPSFTSTGFTTLSGKFAKCSINVGTTGNKFVGRLREITLIRKFQNNLVIRDASNNIVGFTLSNYEDSQTDALLLNY